uniref:Uncharacterized protein n=1 Tax=Utricularia reniformis TaxID=192314 RepID=A0A1Y0B497_9LAMI|nr:hypothetical protein AEK19_MT2056 [Utricularia reniformis]ART32213.1 hypothetical protein AEK19_MT2056 [Utricularia reniformis]
MTFSSCDLSSGFPVSVMLVSSRSACIPVALGPIARLSPYMKTASFRVILVYAQLLPKTTKKGALPVSWRFDLAFDDSFFPIFIPFKKEGSLGSESKSKPLK